MAIKFTKAEGSAKKGMKHLQWKDGENRFRMVGDLLARYVYFINNGKSSASFECLAFDRDQEKFTNIEDDPVPELVEKYQGIPKDKTRCSWGYVIQGIDRTDNQLKLIYLKKKMFEQIMSLASDLGDPTDPEEGYDIIVNREKTGPKVFNVEYAVKSIKMLKEKEKPFPETDAEIIANLKPIDKLVPRPTSEALRAAVEKFLTAKGDDEEEDTSTDTSAIDDLDDDIPF